jgi:SAM-dependent methyltransferase
VTTALTPSSTDLETDAALWQITDIDGDAVIINHRDVAEPQPENWQELLADFLQLAASTAIVGPKRLGPGGNVFSMGEFVVHPKGFHHLGRGTHVEGYRFPEETDVISGGLFAVDGRTLLQGELGAVALCLALRAAGGRCFTVPQVVLTNHATPQPGPQEEQAFFDHFGFDWKAADLDQVRDRYRGSDLLWNQRVLSTALPFEKYERRGALVWESYAKAAYFRGRADHLAKFAKDLCPQGVLLDLGCGDGLFSHLFAMLGVEVLGIDPEPDGIAQACKMTAAQTYPNKRPRFEVGTGDEIPVDDLSIQVVTPSWQFGASSDPVYHNFEYTMEELIRQINSVDGLTVCDKGMISGVYRDLVVIVGKD